MMYEKNGELKISFNPFMGCRYLGLPKAKILVLIGWASKDNLCSHLMFRAANEKVRREHFNNLNFYFKEGYPQQFLNKIHLEEFLKENKGTYVKKLWNI